ncbi:hypothetical protein RRG08_007269 [Elysia crispata]|uniref:Macro domain-containing protein n=1 Tax=Elysia crispata TaxID=231223 RepID=A0AAE0ZUN3_9GAST|nr:hypothetical protein RRG08_007269 [Elysia crispata]
MSRFSSLVNIKHSQLDFFWILSSKTQRGLHSFCGSLVINSRSMASASDQPPSDELSKDDKAEDKKSGKTEDQKELHEDKKSGKTKDQKEVPVDKKSEKKKDQKEVPVNAEGSSPSKYVTRGSSTLRQTKEEEGKKIKEKFLKLKKSEKRKLYKCGEDYTTLDDVERWPQHFSRKLAVDEKMSKWWKLNKKNVTAEINDNLNHKMSLFCGDITTLEIDAIANAANESLLGGGGVDGAIHAAAGPNLRLECELLNGCSGGDAKITCGYKLPAKYVVHTVGPRGEHPKVLESCYNKSLDLLKENKLTSIAFPCISTGIFGYPNLNAAKVALGTIRKWLEKEDYAENIDRIIMCLFLKKDIAIYDEQMQLYFPLDREETGNAAEEK